MKKKIVITILSLLLINFYTNTGLAQNVSLSISPPILEAVIKPGEVVEQAYTLQNSGNETTASIQIYQFEQADEFGNAKIERSLEEYDPLNLKEWFKIKEPQISIGDKFTLGQGEQKTIRLVINPPDNAPDGDYYFTLIFKTSLENSFINTNTKTALSQAEIGSNILITISKEGLVNRKAKIKEFKAPKVIDSFKHLNYELQIANIGEGFFKPFGKITIESILGKKYILNIAPQNIISASSRKISCIENERLIPCQIPAKFLIGPYKATLSFQIEGDKKDYKETVTSFGVPFVILSIIIISALVIILIYRKKLLTNRKDMLA
ncbi:MAG: hypothetical protein KatS3mg088_753 [Patescibacteria group bacterium]|nr:MAG: hypothetical protein KatS3mg088_753 [Patescibacteria group bacterium]